MVALFRDIFAYHHHFNQKLIDELKKHEAVLPARTIPLFAHVINAHQIWNARILGLAEFGVQQLHQLADMAQLDETNYLATQKILDSVDLEKTITYKTSKGQPYTNLVRDILFHAANHTTHHRGQIISDFRQSGIQPLVTDYIFYKRG
ncbi:MAG: damage-inducible protein DinB [Cyclobacteriaceae bacterium]|nr:damage-inducible protein DinB [Cyclobacteriaceae bacterium]